MQAGVSILFHIQKVSSSNLARDFRAHLAVCCDFRIVLIMSQSSLSPIEFASLRALLIKANHDGILDDLLSGLKSSMASGEVDSESSWDAIPGGTMSDASKRQLSPMGQSSAKSGKIGDSPQEVQIVTQDQWKQLESLCHGKLPAQVPSVRQWSKTIISFGKMKSFGLSYLELVTNKDVSFTGYVKWIREHVSESSSAQLKDLAKFIEVFNAVIPLSGISAACFPDSSVVRQYKEN